MAALLLELGLLLATLATAGWVGRRLGQSVIPFYVLGGMAMSPFVLGRVGPPQLAAYAVADQPYLTLLAEVGIVLLLFFLGLEFSLERLLAARRRIATAGVVDLVVNLPLGVAVGLALGWGLLEALVLGGIVYISSSAVITKSLLDLGWIANDEAGPLLGTLVFEDLVIAVYLAVLSAVLLGGGSAAAVAGDLAVALGFLAVLVAAVWLGAGLFERLLRTQTAEQFVLRAVAAAVAVGGVALTIGVSEAVAAFFVGMGFAETSHRERLEGQLRPLRDVFAGVFFFWIGANTDPAVFPAVAGVIAVLVVLTGTAKLATGYAGGAVYGLGHRRRVRVATGMLTRGEFSLIIAALAATAVVDSAVLTQTIPAVAVGYVLVMSILGTLLMQHADRLARMVPAVG